MGVVKSIVPDKSNNIFQLFIKISEPLPCRINFNNFSASQLNFRDDLFMNLRDDPDVNYSSKYLPAGLYALLAIAQTFWSGWQVAYLDPSFLCLHHF